MLSKVSTVGFDGILTREVIIETQITKGLPSFSIVGLPDKTVSESRSRIKGALNSAGISIPAKSITVNLSPADIPKEGSHFDLAIAISLLIAMDILKQNLFDDYIIMGELSLSGMITSIKGVLGASIYANDQNKDLICPHDNDMEAALGNARSILATKSLSDIINKFTNRDLENILEPLDYMSYREKIHQLAQESKNTEYNEISHVIGQENAKRALEISASGGHNMLMIGSPGSGKSMLASCLPSILPPLSEKETIETTLIYNVATKDYKKLIFNRPFIAPHHTSSAPAIVGGGPNATAGAITMAHNGVLFMDEFPEFRRDVLESLRQPLETGTTTIARAKQTNSYPARFQLIGAMNPCRCGDLKNNNPSCNPKVCNHKYMNKISGPLMDRMDIILEISALTSSELELSTKNNNHGESSSVIAKRVQKARNIQEQRYKDLNVNCYVNAHAPSNILHEICNLDEDTQKFLKQASEKFKLTARSYFRTLKVSRTIADLAESQFVQKHHVAEALAYRLRNY